MNKLVDENFSTQIQRSKMRTHFWKPFLASSNFARFCLKKMYFANLGNLEKWAMVTGVGVGPWSQTQRPPLSIR